MACKARCSRKILYRAAEVAQEMFYLYREITFDKLISKVVRNNNEIIIHEGEYDSCLVPFPTALFPDKREKNTILTHLSCGDAYGYLDVILKTMLGDIASGFSEVPVKVKAKNPLKIRSFWANGDEDLNDYQHEVLRVTLKNGSVYVLDLTGAQYGYHEPVMTLEAYKESRAEDVMWYKAQPFGYHRNFIKGQCKVDGSWTSAIRCLTEIFYRCLNDYIKAWQISNMSLPEMLKLRGDTFRANKESFIMGAKATLLKYKNFADGHFKLNKIPIESGGQVDAYNAEERQENLKELLARKGHTVYDLSKFSL